MTGLESVMWWLEGSWQFQERSLARATVGGKL